MEQDTHETPVIFRAERSGPFKGGVTAVFPTLPADRLGHEMTCYAHIGQHSGCSFDWYARTRLATPDEYKDLLAELAGIGYRPKVYKRMTSQHRNELRKNLVRPTIDAALSAK